MATRGMTSGEEMPWQERSTAEGRGIYVMDKFHLSIRLVPPYDEERLAAAREYDKQHEFKVCVQEST